MKKKFLSVIAAGFIAAAAFTVVTTTVEARGNNKGYQTMSYSDPNTVFSKGVIFSEDEATLTAGSVSSKKVKAENTIWNWGFKTYTYSYEGETFETAYVSMDQSTCSDGAYITAEAGTTVGIYYTAAYANFWLPCSTFEMYVATPNDRNNEKTRYATYTGNSNFGTVNYAEYTFTEDTTVALKTNRDNLTVFGFKVVDSVARQEARKVAAAETAINAIGTVSYSDESKALIDAAAAAIAEVADTTAISNMDAYNAAVAEYEAYVAADNQLAADIEAMINDLGDAVYTTEYLEQLTAIETLKSSLVKAAVTNESVYDAKAADYNALKAETEDAFVAAVDAIDAENISRGTALEIKKAKDAYAAVLEADYEDVQESAAKLAEIEAAYEAFMTTESSVAECMTLTAAEMNKDYVLNDKVTLLNVSEITDDYVKADGAKLTLDLTSTITFNIVPEENTLNIYDEDGNLVKTVTVTDGVVEFTLTAGTYTVVPTEVPADFYNVKVVEELGYYSMELMGEYAFDTKGHIIYVTKVSGVNGLVDLNKYSLTIMYSGKTLNVTPTRVLDTIVTPNGTEYVPEENTYYFLYSLGIKATSLSKYAGVEFSAYFTLNGVNSNTLIATFIEE